MKSVIKGPGCIYFSTLYKSHCGTVFHFQPTIFSSPQVVAVFDDADTLLCASLKEPWRLFQKSVRFRIGLVPLNSTFSSKV